MLKDSLPVTKPKEETKQQPQVSKAYVSDLYDEFSQKFGKMIDARASKKGVQQNPVDRQNFINQSFGKFLGEQIAPKLGWSSVEIQAAMQLAGVGGLGPDPEMITQARSAAFNKLKTAEDEAQKRFDETSAALGKFSGVSMRGLRQDTKGADLLMTEAGVPRNAIKGALITSKTDPANIEGPLRIAGVPFAGPIAKLFGKNYLYDEKAAFDLQNNPVDFGRGMFLRESFGAPGYQNPGASKLEAVGVNSVLAEIVTGDLFDPVSYVGGARPLLFLAGAGAFGGYKYVRTMLAARNARVLIEGQELILEAQKAAKMAEDMINWKPSVQPGLSSEQIAQSVSGMASQAQDAGRSVTAGQAARSTKILTGLAKGVKTIRDLGHVDIKLRNIASKLDPVDRRELLRLRLQMVTSSEELAGVQKTFAPLVEDFPQDWNKALSHHYMDPDTGLTKRVPGGLLREFHQNPTRFISKDGTHFLGNKNGRALMKIVGATDKEDTAAMLKFQKYAYMGNSPDLQRMIAGMPKLASTLGEENALTGVGAKMLKARIPRYALGNTPAMQHLVNSEGAYRTWTEAKLLEMMGHLGGKAWKLDDSSLGIMAGGRTGLKAAHISKLSQDQIDAVGTILSGEHKGFMRALNQKRELNGLPAMNMDSALKVKDSEKLSVGMRHFLDDLHGDGVASGQLTPEQYVQSYFPLMGGAANGENTDQIVRNMSNEALKAGRTKEFEWYSMPRIGDLTPTETDFPTVMEAYVRKLGKQKFMKPALDQLREVLQDPNNKMSLQERDLMRQYMLHHAGGVSSLQWALTKEQVNDQGIMREIMQGSAAGERVLKAMESAPGTSAIRSLTRNIADFYYTNYIGLRPGLSARNWFQQLLGLKKLGGKPYLAMAYPEWETNTAIRADYARIARQRGWIRAPEAFFDRQFQLKTGVRQTVKDDVLHSYMWADHNSRSKLFTAMSLKMDDVIADAERGGMKWKSVARNIDTKAERGAFTDAMLKGDYEAAKDLARVDQVEGTQWLYSNKNRPMWADKPILAQAYMFKSWTFNAAEQTIAEWARGIRKAGGPAGAMLPRSSKQAAQAMSEVTGFWAPYMAMIGMAAVAASPLGLNLFSWGWSDAPESVKQAVGYDPTFDKKRYLPSPVPSAINPEPYVDKFLEQFTSGRALRDIKNMTVEAYDTGIANMRGEVDPNQTRLSQPIINSIFNSIPITPIAARPLTAWAARASGIPEDTELRNNMERILAGLAGMPDPQKERKGKIGPTKFMLEALGFKTFTEDENPLNR